MNKYVLNGDKYELLDIQMKLEEIHSNTFLGGVRFAIAAIQRLILTMTILENKDMIIEELQKELSEKNKEVFILKNIIN